MSKKRIYITEAQKKRLNEELSINLQYHVDPEKVKAITSYMDKAFKRGSMSIVNDEGFPEEKAIVALIDSAGNPLRNMTSKQMFYLLQDRFKNLYDDKKQRDAFLKQIIKDWYYRKISKEGLLSVNSY